MAFSWVSGLVGRIIRKKFCHIPANHETCSMNDSRRIIYDKFMAEHVYFRQLLPSQMKMASNIHMYNIEKVLFFSRKKSQVHACITNSRATNSPGLYLLQRQNVTWHKPEITHPSDFWADSGDFQLFHVGTFFFTPLGTPSSKKTSQIYLCN